MNKKIIFFSIDRLGDYLIRSNVIKKISDNFTNVEIITSEKNNKLITSQTFFTNVILFNTKNKVLNKLKFILLFFLKSYDTAIALDGKNISTLLLFFIKAKFKFTYVYKKKGLVNLIYLKFIIFFFNIFKIKYEFLNSRALIINNEGENYPKMYQKLKKYFNNIENKTYFLQETKITNYDELFEKFVIIHLDEKYQDIINIDINFDEHLKKFQKEIDKKVIITSFNNTFNYYKKIKLDKINFNNLNNDILYSSKILIIENMPLDHFQNLLKNSHTNISCHSGYFVHTSLALNKRTIDIINKTDEIWYNNWIDDYKNYKKVYKSILNKKIEINEILNNIAHEIKKN